MTKLEADLQSDILTDLRSYGKYCECFKVTSTSDNGFPDIFFTTDYTGAIFVETKKEKASARLLQQVKIESLNRCGTKAFICDSWKEWVALKEKIGFCAKNIIPSKK